MSLELNVWVGFKFVWQLLFYPFFENFIEILNIFELKIKATV